MNLQAFNTALIILTEQMLPDESSIDRYIMPIVRYMVDEWARIKKIIADTIIDAGRKPISEAILNEREVFFPSGRQNMVKQMINALIGSMSHEVGKRVSEAKRQAKIDFAMPGLTDPDVGPMRITLTREGLQEVIDALDYQKDFIDDYRQTTEERVMRLLQARYGSITDLKDNVYREFRIDRDQTMRLFHREVEGYAKKVIDGTMDVESFVSNMESSIGKFYERLYREGKNVTDLADWERELIRKQTESQRQYLNNFADYIRTKQATGKELTSYIEARADLYAERGSAMFEAGQVNAWPDDVLIDWVMQPAEHCTTCPIYQSNSPYTKETLPGYPGEGFHLTQCGTNCKCLLRVSDLYVGELRGI